MLVLVVGLAVALLASAVLTAAELAIFDPSDARVRTLAEEGFRGGKALAKLRARPERILVLLRLGDALADVAAGALAGSLAWILWGTPGLIGGIVVAALGILYLGELLPIGIATNHGLRLALIAAPVALPFVRMLGWPLEQLARLARVRAPSRENGPSDTEIEIRQLTALGHDEGVIEEHERELIERAFRLDRTRVWDIMTPRVDIFAWRDDLRLRDIAPELSAVRFSRVPVYRETIDDISGVLYLRDVYQALISGQRDIPLRSLAREPLVVPGSVPLAKLLRDFQNRRIHLAIVVDEYGGTDGLVTLEDVIEELVGEIEDETDLAEEPILRISRNEILAAGDADLREINHFFNTTLPQLEHRSLNGWLLEELGRVPEPGEVIERDGVRVDIVEATDTQVTRARLRRLAGDAVTEQQRGLAWRDGGTGAGGRSERTG